MKGLTAGATAPAKQAAKEKNLAMDVIKPRWKMMDNSFASVWQRIEAHQGKPFLMPNGREFHYVMEGGKLRFSCHREPIEKAMIEEALQSMPCESFQELPRHLKPRNALWTLLNDTRIYQRPKFADYQPNEFWQRRSMG